MRKYVIGGLVGLAIGMSATAFADDISSLIGQKIQGQTNIYLDGAKIDTAIIVDGKSYAPTRKVAEASGRKVTFNKGGVYLETQGKVTDSPPANGDGEPTKEDRLLSINNRIKVKNGEIVSINISLALATTTDETEKLKASLAEKQQQLADLESQKAELEAK